MDDCLIVNLHLREDDLMSGYGESKLLLKMEGIMNMLNLEFRHCVFECLDLPGGKLKLAINGAEISEEKYLTLLCDMIVERIRIRIFDLEELALGSKKARPKAEVNCSVF